MTLVELSRYFVSRGLRWPLDTAVTWKTRMASGESTYIVLDELYVKKNEDSLVVNPDDVLSSMVVQR